MSTGMSRSCPDDMYEDMTICAIVIAVGVGK